MLEVIDIDISIVNVALTDIQASVGATISEIGWVVTGYAIANVIIIPLTAWLGDTFGKKHYFVFSWPIGDRPWQPPDLFRRR